MRYLVQAQGVFERGVFLEQLDYAAIIGLEELAKNQNGKKLSLGKIVPAAQV